MRQKNKITESVAINALSIGIVLIMLFTAILPRIEQYTQGPALDAMEANAGTNTYLATYGYKSYAQFFYFKYPSQANKMTDDAVYLLDNDMDKPVLIVAKCNYKVAEANPKLKFLYQKGGFRFYVKKALEQANIVGENLNFFYLYSINRTKLHTGFSNILQIDTSNSARFDTSATLLYGNILNIANKQPIKDAVVNIKVFSYINKEPRTIEECRKFSSNAFRPYSTKTNTNGVYNIGAPCQGLFKIEVSAPGYYSFIDTLHGGYNIGRKYGLDIGLKKKQ